MFKVNDADVAAAARPQEDENAHGAVALAKAEAGAVDPAEAEDGAVAQPQWNTDAVKNPIGQEKREQRVERFIRDNYPAPALFTVPGILQAIAEIGGELLAADPANRADLLTVSRSTVNRALDTLRTLDELIVHNSKTYILVWNLSADEILALPEVLSRPVENVMNNIRRVYEVGDTFTEMDVIFVGLRYPQFRYRAVKEAVKILLRRGYLQVAVARSPGEALIYTGSLK